MNNNNKVGKLLYKYLIFFILGGGIYYSIEVFARGYSHISMFILGGLCYILIGCINEFFPWEMYIEVQAILGALIVTALEFITGCIVNLWLGLEVWDYSDMPYNLLGQICLAFSLAWIALSVIAIMLDDWVRYKCFGEEKPRYISVFYNTFKLITGKKK